MRVDHLGSRGRKELELGIEMDASESEKLQKVPSEVCNNSLENLNVVSLRGCRRQPDSLG